MSENYTEDCGKCGRSHPLEHTDDPDEAQCKRELVKKDAGEDCNARVNRPGYCQRTAGHGVEGKDTGRCSTHGGRGGAPAGPDNGNWKHGGYSDYMREEDQKRAERWIEVDGEEKRLEAVGDMLWEVLAWQKARIERAMELVKDPHREETALCRVCGTAVQHEDLVKCPNPGCDSHADPSDESVDERLAIMWDDPDLDQFVEVDDGLEHDDGSVFWRIEQFSDTAESYRELVEENELHLSGDVDLSWPERLKMAQQGGE